ncbi:hypothetical protein M514_08502, partial [Trichuris suis]
MYGSLEEVLAKCSHRVLAQQLSCNRRLKPHGLRARRGMHSSELTSYLCECMRRWRLRPHEEPFNKMLEEVVTQ